METNPPIFAFATAFSATAVKALALLALGTAGCAASLQPTEPHVPPAYVQPAAGEEDGESGAPAPRQPLPAVIHARAFGERPAPNEPARIADVPFLAPDTSRAGAEPCRLISIPEGGEPAPPLPARASGDVRTSGALAAGSTQPLVRAQPPTVTVTGFRGRAPVDIAWAFPVPPSRNGGPPPAAPTGKTLVQMALFDAMPSPDAKPRSVLQCTSEIDSIAWAVPRTMVDQLLGSAPTPGAVVRVSVARAPGKLADMPKPTSAPRYAVGAFVDLPVERDGSLSRR